MFYNIKGYTYINFLGNGVYGQVGLYKKNNTNEYYAIKRINKNKAKHSKNYKYLHSELQILKKLNHENISKLIDIIDNDFQFDILIVMEYCHGFSLSKCLEYYKEKYAKPFTEEIVQYLTRQIVHGLIHIHEQNVIHRDLKLENIMVHFDNEMDKTNLNMMKGTIKIIDFGLSKLLSSSKEFATSFVGTIPYIDPRIITIKNFQYSKEADIWSLGCICYEMLTGKKVFETQLVSELITKIKEGKYKLPQTISREFISFLNSMLQYDGNLRLTAKQLLEKRFLRKNIKEFHYLNVNHDLKQDKEFLALKSSIQLYNQNVNENIQKSYKKHISFEQKNPNSNLIQEKNNLNQNSPPSINKNSYSNKSLIINNGFSFYGQSMIPEEELTNIPYINKTHSVNLNHQNLLSVSNDQNNSNNLVNNNNFNINNNTNIKINYQQSNNNNEIDIPLQRYNSEPIEKKKDDFCIVF